MVLKLLLMAALVLSIVGEKPRERPKGWVRDPTRVKKTDPLDWKDCDKPCDGGTREETTRDWKIPCNTFPCDNPLSCECGSADILFVMDNTGSILQRQAFVLKHFIMDVIQGMARHGGVDAEDSRIGVISFENTSYVALSFDSGFGLANPEETSQKVFEIPRTLGYTNISGALRMSMEMFTFMQSDKKKVAVVLTDGDANIDKDDTTPAAEALHDAGVGVFAIGIGDVRKRTLKNIASKPEEEFYFKVGKVTELRKIINNIMEAVCCNTQPPECLDVANSGCSTTCGGGTMMRTVSCTHFGFGGVPVKTETVELEVACGEEDCPGGEVCFGHEIGEEWLEKLICTCNEGSYNVCTIPPRDCDT